MAFNYDNFTDIKVTRDEKDGRIAIVTLNRPDRMNAWRDLGLMGSDLVRAFNQFDQDDSVRVVVVTGAGKAFCAGADLQQADNPFGDRGRGRTLQNARDGGGQAALAISRCRKVVIAAVNGAAVGIGITCTLPMDIRFAWKDAKIGFVFTRRGIVPEATSTYHLPRLIGHSKTMALMLTGEVIPASHRWLEPLWADLLPRPEDVLPAALDMARTIATKTSALSCAMVKALVWRGAGTPEEQHLLDSRAMFATGLGPDAAEGVRSFREKRDVKFEGSVTKDMGAGTNFSGFYPWWRAVETDGVPKL
ncbi:ClpP/crotonase-like domain-containing protein [Hyaloraphidium curvatum]|nr:ClpP/crotonase-like domain-containing protein [Hyaloraphidium curvatum]